MRTLAHKLDIATTRLYNHVRNLDDVQRAVQLASIVELNEYLSSATIGLSGPASLRATVEAYRSWTASHPHRYRSITAASPNPEAIATALLNVNMHMAAVLASCGVGSDEADTAASGLLVALHGCVVLGNSGFINEHEGDQLYDQLYEVVLRYALKRR